jgi:hypothetical protein
MTNSVAETHHDATVTYDHPNPDARGLNDAVRANMHVLSDLERQSGTDAEGGRPRNVSIRLGRTLTRLGTHPSRKVVEGRIIVRSPTKPYFPIPTTAP